MSDDYHLDICSGSENDSDHLSGPENDSDHLSGPENDSDISGDSEAEDDRDERELMIKYTDDENFDVDMTGFELSTLQSGLELISKTIVFQRNRIAELKRYIQFVIKEMETGEIKDFREQLREILAQSQWDLTCAEKRLDCFIRKQQYVKSRLEELDTVVDENESVGELGETWGEQSDPEEDYDWGFEQLAIHEGERRETEDGRGEYEEERGAFDARIDDNVLSGWRRLLRQYHMNVDVAAFLIDTGLHNVDLQPFMDCIEDGTAEEVQERINELRDISTAVTFRRDLLPRGSGESPVLVVLFQRNEHFCLAEEVLNDLMFDLLNMQNRIMDLEKEFLDMQNRFRDRQDELSR